MIYLQKERDVMVEMVDVNDHRTGNLVALILQESPRFVEI